MNDTIYALASGPGMSGVAVIRVSGPRASALGRALGAQEMPAPRLASLRRFRDPRDGQEIDSGLLLWFPGPHSFTGEDVAEFHIHGGHAIIGALSEALSAGGESRLAEPGEFTRRAFENGKIDLTAAEAVADLVAAQTVAQRQLALRQYDGALAVLYENWRTRLIQIMGRLEAEIDFTDEELPQNLIQEAKINISVIFNEISQHLLDGRRGENIRDGFKIAILGPPNAGKSSIINRLSAREVAIVSDVAGTTRDIIEIRLNLGGFMVTLADTAGLRAPANAIEAEGIRRARAFAARADFRILVVDAALGAPGASETHFPNEEADLVVLNKTDLLEGAKPCAPAGRPSLEISAKTGLGIDALLELLTQKVSRQLQGTEAPVLTRKRHREALEAASSALDRAVGEAQPELAAEDIRLAAQALGRITGRVDVDEVLDVVFRDFCIGK